MKSLVKIFFGPSKRICRRNRPTIPLGLAIDEYKDKKLDFLKVAQDKIEYFNKFYNFKYKNITIRNQKTRWGSCSIKGNLNFNYRTFLLSEELMDYVIVHEICHLKEMNHSRSFWILVEEQIPDFKEKRKELKKYYFNCL